MTRRLWISCHPDDHLLFMSPDLLHAVQAGDTIQAVHLNAGDAGGTSTYWQGRETGTQAGFANMYGVSNSWTTADAGISGHLAPLYTLNGVSPAPTLIFLRLPDGNTDNTGFSAYGNQTMENLWTGGLTTITPDDGTATYTKTQLTTVLAGLITAFSPDVIHTHEAFGDFGHQAADGSGGSADHPDHHATGLFAAAAIAQAGYSPPVTYQGYPATFRPTNVTGADSTAKNAAYSAYLAFDALGGGSTIYEPIQYRTSGPGVTAVTAVASGPNSFAGGLLRVMVLTQGLRTQAGATGGSTSAGQASVTTTQTGSRVYGAATVTSLTTLAANGSTTQIDAVTDSVNSFGYGSFKATALTGTPGAATIGDSNGSLCAMAEILTAGTLTEDASAPPASQVNITTVQHSAEFSPPAGSLVVALWAMNSASSSSPAVAVSGGNGWAWTQLKLTFGAAGAATVWYAAVPASTPASPQRPGKTWLRRFRHRQQILQGAAVTVTAAGTAAPAAGAVTAVVTQIAPAAGAGTGAASASAGQAAGAVAAGAGAASAVASQLAGASAAAAAAVTGTVTQIAAAAAAGAASVTAAGSVSGASTATGAGAGAVTAVVTQIAPAAASGGGAVTAAVTQAAGAVAAGAGLAGPAPVTQIAPAASAGAGAVADVATQIVIASAAGAGSVTASGSVTGAGATASAAGAGAVTATATQIAPATAAGAGAVTDVATQAAKAAAAGAGAVTASGAITGTASAAGAGTATAKTVQIAPATAAGAGTMTALAAQAATAALTAAGSVTAAGNIQLAFTVGTLTASDQPLAVLGAGTAATAAQNTLTAGTQTTGGPS